MAIPAVLVVIAAARPVSLVATQWGDPRKTVEARLAALPEGARVEAWGRLVYLPRFDDGPYQVHHIHPHRDPRRRPPIPGAELVRADYAELEERSPEVLVVPQEFVSKHIGMSTSGDRVTAEHILRYRRNDAVVDLLQKAVNDELPGYRLALRAEAELPAWMAALGLSPVQIHGSTGRSVWVWRRSGAPQDER